MRRARVRRAHKAPEASSRSPPRSEAGPNIRHEPSRLSFERHDEGAPTTQDAETARQGFRSGQTIPRLRARTYGSCSDGCRGCFKSVRVCVQDLISKLLSAAARRQAIASAQKNITVVRTNTQVFVLPVRRRVRAHQVASSVGGRSAPAAFRAGPDRPRRAVGPTLSNLSIEVSCGRNEEGGNQFAACELLGMGSSSWYASSIAATAASTSSSSLNSRDSLEPATLEAARLESLASCGDRS